MASSQRLILRVCITIFFCCCFVSLSSGQRITLSLYYEALCPYCAEFMVNHLPKLFEYGLSSLVDLQLVPWGNTIIRPDGSILCQHGEAECALNAFHACAINSSPDALTYILCTERLVFEKNHDKLAWAYCLGTDGPIDCYRNGYANQLEKRYAEETSELKPPHEYVPWVVVNNQPLRENYENFLMYVCNAYEIIQKPDGCKNLNTSVVEEAASRFHHSMEKLSHNNDMKVCYPNP